MSLKSGEPQYCVSEAGEQSLIEAQFFGYKMRCTARSIYVLEKFNIFKPGARQLQPACAWFLEITFVPPKYVCACVCVCVHPQGHK